MTNERSSTKHYLKRFSTFPKGLRELATWVKSYNCLDVCMESAGKYWVPIFNTLESAGLRVCLTHPKYVKAIKGKKTDKKDAHLSFAQEGLQNYSNATTSFAPVLFRRLRFANYENFADTT